MNIERSLPKWPGLLVTGKSVTREQAMEVIIRTDNLQFISNDQTFAKRLNLCVYGVAADSFERYDCIRNMLKIPADVYDPIFEYEDKCRDAVKQLELSYMNNYRIVSSWVGGPHGWMHWDGTVGCNNYNIGKYPSVQDVFEDLTVIAHEFSFLDMRVQLLDKEIGEDGARPVVEFIVKDGTVITVEPLEMIAEMDMDYTFNNFSVLTSGGERGCTYDQFAEAFDMVKLKFKI